MDLADYLALPESKAYSRVPIFSGDKDNVTGMVLKDDVLTAKVGEDDKRELKDLKRPVSIISDTVMLPDLLLMTRKDKQHLHLVADEFGQVVGVVSMEDLFETLLGTEIVDESDMHIDLQEHARKQWKEKNKQG